MSNGEVYSQVLTQELLSDSAEGKVPGITRKDFSEQRLLPQYNVDKEQKSLKEEEKKESIKNSIQIFLPSSLLRKKLSKKENILKCYGFYVTLIFTILSFIGSVIMCGTNMYDRAIQKIVTLSEGGFVFNLWRDPKQDLLVFVYLFNYTNMDAVLAGKEMPKVEEIGPYVYRERMTKVNIVFNGVESLTYSENVSITFLSELSNGNLNETVISPNLEVLGALNLVRESSMFTQLGLSALLKNMKYQPFVNKTVHDFIHGYDVGPTRILKNVMKLVDEKFPRSGIIHDGVRADRITIGTGIPNLESIGMIQEYNGRNESNAWDSECCRNIRASDGFLYPAELISSKETIYSFRYSLCRRIPFKFQKYTRTIQDYPAKRYVITEEMFDSRIEENQCFCLDSSCYPAGVSNAAPCYYGVPLIVSLPHFLFGDKILLEDVIGLNPDPEKHGSYFDIHKTGVPLKTVTRLQMGIVLNKARYVSFMKNVKDGIVLPVCWLSLESANLTGVVNDLIYHLSFTVDLVKQILQWSLPILLVLFLIRLMSYIFLQH